MAGPVSGAFRFPLFVDLTGKKVVIVGGGAVARRRIAVLRPFGAEITVIAPSNPDGTAGVRWLERRYEPGDLAGAFLAVAATDDREVNRQVGLEARSLGIPVSVADREEECTFYFPAICAGKDVIAGVVSHGGDHRATAEAARKIRGALAETEGSAGEGKR